MLRMLDSDQATVWCQKQTVALLVIVMADARL
ncbi:hypothetical protein C7431_101239 [Pantoea allii]|uniref:Uncharacterized protein n=1 Tax=Pantoea allii TaxID=574096 RepID=A0A2V2BMX1_9GAMM|nr:hypothetical protein C7431_101239 [Pantoea allii]